MRAEGADILMVKPALILSGCAGPLRAGRHCDRGLQCQRRVCDDDCAAERGWGDLRAMVRESTFAMARAGADIIISYWAGR